MDTVLSNTEGYEMYFQSEEAHLIWRRDQNIISSPILRFPPTQKQAIFTNIYLMSNPDGNAGNVAWWQVCLYRLMKGKFGMQKIILVYTALYLHLQFKCGVSPDFRI